MIMSCLEIQTLENYFVPHCHCYLLTVVAIEICPNYNSQIFIEPMNVKDVANLNELLELWNFFAGHFQLPQL